MSALLPLLFLLSLVLSPGHARRCSFTDPDCDEGQICIHGDCLNKAKHIGDLCVSDRQCRDIGVEVLCLNNRCSCGEGKELRGQRCFTVWTPNDTLIVVLCTFLPIIFTVSLTLLIVSWVNRRRRRREETQRRRSLEAVRASRAAANPRIMDLRGSNSGSLPDISSDDDKPPSYVSPPSYSTAVAGLHSP